MASACRQACLTSSLPDEFGNIHIIYINSADRLHMGLVCSRSGLEAMRGWPRSSAGGREGGSGRPFLLYLSSVREAEQVEELT